MLQRRNGVHDPTERGSAASRRVARPHLPERIGSVLIADADTLFRVGLREAIGSLFAGAAFAEAGNADALRALLREGRFDMLLLDLALPGLNGYLSLLVLRQEHPRMRVVAVSGIDTPAVRQRTRAFGVARFISKRATPEAITAAIASAVAPPRNGPARLPARERRLIDGLFALTRAERNVLVALPDNPSHRHLMGSLGIALPTVKTHMSRILAKLGLRNRTEAAVVASRLANVAAASLCLESGRGGAAIPFGG